MEIIAKTKNGCLIQASKHEVKEIIQAVSGKDKDQELSIGQKIPAIDYATTITRVKALGRNHDYQMLLNNVEGLNVTIQTLKESIRKASLIELEQNL